MFGIYTKTKDTDQCLNIQQSPPLISWSVCLGQLLKAILWSEIWLHIKSQLLMLVKRLLTIKDWISGAITDLILLIFNPKSSYHSTTDNTYIHVTPFICQCSVPVHVGIALCRKQLNLNVVVWKCVYCFQYGKLLAKCTKCMYNKASQAKALCNTWSCHHCSPQA